MRVIEVAEEKDRVRLRYRPTWYQTGIGQPPPEEFQIDWKDWDTQSYAFIVLPRSNKVLILEEDVHDIIGDPPEWKERVRFPAIEK